MAIGTVIVGAIAGGALVGTVAGALLAGAINLVVSFGIGAVVRAIQRRRQGEQSDVVGVYGALRGGGVVSCSFIHGRWATAGSLVYREVWGADGKTPNAYYVTVIALSDLPVQDLAGLIVNSQVCTVDLGGPAASQGVPIPEFNVEGKDHLWVRFHDGTQTTADSYLVDKFGANADHPWTDDAVATGIAYLVLTALVNDELFRGWPEYLAVVEGVRFYDVREDTTAGGEGDQRWADPGTHVYSANPLVAAYNILRGIAYGGENFYGGKRVGAVNLPFSEWAAAMNACDEPVDLAGGGTEPQFVAGGEITVDTPPAQIIDELMTASAGRIAESGGIYKPYVGAPGAAVAAFTDGDIVVTEAQDFEPFFDLGESINGISSRYISEAEGWQWKDAAPRTFPLYEAEDGGIRNLTGIAYGRVSSPTQVQRLDEAAVHDSRRQRTHVLTLAPWLSRYEPGEVLAWTSARNGYSGKLFRIEKADDKDNLDYRVTLRETDPGDYDWDSELELPVLTGAPAVVRPPPQPLVGWAATGILVVHDNGQRTAGARLEWDPDVDDVVGVRFQIRLAATEELILDATTDAWEAGEGVTTQNLASITAYQARGRYIPGSPRPADWSDWLGFTTPDARVNQDALDAALDARIRQIEAQIPAEIRTLRADLDAVAGALATQVTELREEVGWTTTSVGARYQENKAGVELASFAAANANSALAAMFGEVFAISEAGEASAGFRMIASSAPEGALAAVAWQVRVGDDGEVWAEATLEMAAYDDPGLGPISRIRLIADRVDLVVGGEVLSASLLVAQDAAFPTPIMTGTPNTITPNLANLRRSYRTLMNDDAEMQFPAGATAGRHWVHIIEQDDTGGRELTVDEDVFITAAPEVTQIPHGVTILDGEVLNTDPPLAALSVRTIGSTVGGLPEEAILLDASQPGTYQVEVPVYNAIDFEAWGVGGTGGNAGQGSYVNPAHPDDVVIRILGGSELLRAASGHSGISVLAPGAPTGGAAPSGSSGFDFRDPSQAGQNGIESSTPPAAGAGGNSGESPAGEFGAGAPHAGSSGDAHGKVGSAPGGGGSGARRHRFAGSGVGGGASGGDYVNRSITAGTLAPGIVLEVIIPPTIAAAAFSPQGNHSYRGGRGGNGRVRIRVS